jgi:hypothetical protein
LLRRKASLFRSYWSIQCNLSAQKAMEEWQEHVSLTTSSDSSGYQFTISSTEFHTDSESLIKRHKTVRDTTVPSAYHRLKSDDDVIRAIQDLESRIPMAITHLSLGRRSPRQDESSRRIIMAGTTQRACRRIGDGRDR